MWKNKINHREAVNRIVQLSQRDLSTQQTKKELFSILSTTDKWEYDKVVTWVIDSYKKAEWYDEKRKLQMISPMVASYTKENRWEDKTDKEETRWWKPWVVTLIRGKDSTWKYKVYKYQVKNWWYPKHIINEYVRQTKWNNEWVKITDSKWREYSKDKKFFAWDVVYIKAHIESKESKETNNHIEIQENYIKNQSDSNKEMLEKFNKEHPMWKDVEMTFWFPVRSYEDIEKTLAWLTTKQIGIKPEQYEVIILLNRPNKNESFSEDTRQKILKFKKEHPEFNIHIFEKTFNFKKDEKGKYKINYWRIYKTLWDTLVYRNLQRKNIKWMDLKKIENLIIKTWAADSTDKNPRYIANQLEKYANQYWGKELVRMIWESRLPANVCETYPLVELLEFFQRHFDNEYVGWPLNRNVWIWSYKSRIYCDAGGFDPKYYKWEDVNLVSKVKSRVKHTKNAQKITMHYDDWFVWAIDESCDRWIWAMVEKGRSYCERYIGNEWDAASKEKNRNKFAVNHKWEEKFKVLELTKQNLEMNLSAFYRQRINNIFTGRTTSKKYNKYLDWEWKNTTPQEKAERIAKNVINPIMEKVLWRNDFMWLDKSDYNFWTVVTEKYKDENAKKDKYRVKSASIKFSENSVTKILNIQEQKKKNWYYNYR